MESKTILIADDNPVVLKALEMGLRSAGYRVITVLEPNEALAKVRAEKPDVIIMDINFPPDVGFGGGGTWDGYRIFEWLRLNQTLGNAILFIITAEDIQKHQDKAKAAGVRALFQKPVNRQALLEKLKECLESPASAADSAS